MRFSIDYVKDIDPGSQVEPFFYNRSDLLDTILMVLKIKANGACKQCNASMTSITTECNERTVYHLSTVLLIINSREPPRRLLITKYAIKILTCNAFCS